MSNLPSKIKRLQLLKREFLKRITPEIWNDCTEGQRGVIILSLLDQDTKELAVRYANIWIFS